MARRKRIQACAPIDPEIFRKLPNELVLAIINACSSVDRATLLRVSKRLNGLATKSLYHSISITTHRDIVKLAETLFLKPDLAAMVRIFNVSLIAKSSAVSVRYLRMIIRFLKNLEQLQLHADVPIASLWFSEIISAPFPKLSRLILGIAPADLHLTLLEACLSDQESLEHLTIQVTFSIVTTSPSNKVAHVKANLPKLKSYYGPPFLLQSLSERSKMLSFLTLDFVGLKITEPGLEDRLKYLKAIIPKQDGENIPLSSLMILSDHCEMIELVSRHLPPNVIQLSFSHIVSSATSSLHPLLQVDLDSLSHIPSLYKFTIYLWPQSEFRTLSSADPETWYPLTLADSIWNSLPDIHDVTIHGAHFRKAPDGSKDILGTPRWMILEDTPGAIIYPTPGIGFFL